MLDPDRRDEIGRELLLGYIEHVARQFVDSGADRYMTPDKLLRGIVRESLGRTGAGPGQNVYQADLDTWLLEHSRAACFGSTSLRQVLVKVCVLVDDALLG
jgi:hypothetical protein